MTREISPIATAAKASTAVEQNTLKRRGVGLRACDRERACPDGPPNSQTNIVSGAYRYTPQEIAAAHVISPRGGEA